METKARMIILINVLKTQINFKTPKTMNQQLIYNEEIKSDDLHKIILIDFFNFLKVK